MSRFFSSKDRGKESSSRPGSVQQVSAGSEISRDSDKSDYSRVKDSERIGKKRFNYLLTRYSKKSGTSVKKTSSKTRTKRKDRDDKNKHIVDKKLAPIDGFGDPAHSGPKLKANSGNVKSKIVTAPENKTLFSKNTGELLRKKSEKRIPGHEPSGVIWDNKKSPNSLSLARKEAGIFKRILEKASNDLMITEIQKYGEVNSEAEVSKFKLTIKTKCEKFYDSAVQEFNKAVAAGSVAEKSLISLGIEIQFLKLRHDAIMAMSGSPQGEEGPRVQNLVFDDNLARLKIKLSQEDKDSIHNLHVGNYGANLLIKRVEQEQERIVQGMTDADSLAADVSSILARAEGLQRSNPETATGESGHSEKVVRLIEKKQEKLNDKVIENKARAVALRSELISSLNKRIENIPELSQIANYHDVFRKEGAGHNKKLMLRQLQEIKETLDPTSAVNDNNINQRIERLNRFHSAVPVMLYICDIGTFYVDEDFVTDELEQAFKATGQRVMAEANALQSYNEQKRSTSNN